MQYRSLDTSKYNFSLISFADRKDLEEILQEYANQVSDPSPDDAEVIMEQFNILKARGLNAKEWLVRIFHELSKKDKQKQNIHYLVGMIRNRSTYGWGASRSIEERALIARIVSVVGKSLSQEGCIKVYSMMGNYGTARVSLALHDIEIEKLFFEKLEHEIKCQEKDE